jgi:hypothetical protein
MKVNTWRIILFLTMMIFSFNLSSENIQLISNKQIEKYGDYNVFIIKYSNMVYEKEGKIIKIPIFQGTYGDILYKDFRDYCLKMKYLKPKVRESGFIVKSKKGELRQNFHEFLNFYKSNIFKDIDVNKPTTMTCDGYEWFIDYDFSIENIPCYITIRIDSSEEDNMNYRNYNSPYQIKTKEKNNEPFFSYAIHVGAKSTK